MKVNCPKVNGNIILRTYGTLEIGGVPRFDFVTRLAPSPMKNKPAKNTKYRTANLIFGNYDTSGREKPLGERVTQASSA
jgi:hypothetical protein